MPLYEYECPACRLRRDVLQQRFDDPPPMCGCGQAAMTRVVSAPAIQFKGSGWYVTDYARKGES